MILSRKGRPGEVAEIERLNLRRAGVFVLQRFLAGLYRERTEIAIRERAKCGLPDAGYSYWSHTSRITRTFRLLNRAREQADGYLWLRCAGDRHGGFNNSDVLASDGAVPF